MTPRNPEALLPLTPVAFHSLLALAGGARHGYAIAQEVEAASGGVVRMGPGTLYGALQRLQDERLVEEAPNPGEDGVHAGRRRYYRLTPLGREVLEAETERLAAAVRLAKARIGAG